LTKVLILLTLHLFRYATPFFKFNLQKGGKNFTYVGMSINKYPRIRLHWIDILGDTGWADEDEFQEMKCSTCVSEGHLFHKDENSVMTFASYEIEDGEIISYGDRNIYPIGVIRKIEYL
jgi:hypothetical protein